MRCQRQQKSRLSNIIDVTLSLRSDMPKWPGSVGVELRRAMSLACGDSANGSVLVCDVHIGTHVDAPRHFLEGGSTVEQLPLDVMVGPCFVAYLPEVEYITSDDLADLDFPSGTERLLLRTGNSTLWAAETREFREDYVALTEDAARWVVGKGVRLIGVDYLSVQRYGDSAATHQILLEAGVVIVEGLNLCEVEAGFYELICLPLKLVDAEGAPARVILRRVSEFGKGQSTTGASL